MINKLTIFILFLFVNHANSQTIFDNDCRDSSGSLIENCTCSDVYGNIVDCTTGEIIPPSQDDDGSDEDEDNGSEDDEDEGGSDDDEGGGSSGEDDGISNGQVNKRSSIPGKQISVPIYLNIQLNPEIIYTFDGIARFDVCATLLWSLESQPFKSDDKFTFSIFNFTNGNPIHLKKDVDYFLDVKSVKLNTINFHVEFKNKVYYGFYLIEVKYNDDYKITSPLFVIKKRKTTSSSTVVERNTLYRNIKE